MKNWGHSSRKDEKNCGGKLFDNHRSEKYHRIENVVDNETVKTPIVELSRVTRVQRKLISSERLCHASGGGKGQLGQRCISAVSGTMLVRGQCFDDLSTSTVLGNSDSATFLREQGSLGFPSVVSSCIALPTDLVCDTAAFQFMRDDLVDVVRSHSSLRRVPGRLRSDLVSRNGPP